MAERRAEPGSPWNQRVVAIRLAVRLPRRRHGLAPGEALLCLAADAALPLRLDISTSNAALGVGPGMDVDS